MNFEISSKILARNTLLNFIGQILPLIVSIVTLPYIIRGLGVERFGILSISWVIVGYFTIFDLGLGRATTKYLAEVFGKGEEKQIPHLIWTSVISQIILGVIFGLVFIAITPLITNKIFKIPLELISEANLVFYLLALSVPIVLASGSFSGVLEARQRFDLLNLVRIPSSIIMNLLTLLGLMLGFKLPGIMIMIILSRFVTLSVFMFMTLHLFPKIIKFSLKSDLLPSLFKYGGWITITNLISYILSSLDRFLIGYLLSIAAVSYYSPPYEIGIRLMIIPMSITTVLFPAFSSLHSMKDQEKIKQLYSRSFKYLLISLSPIVILITIMSGEILQLWLGSDFAEQSKVALQFIVLGILFNSVVGSIPHFLLQGAGRPDIAPKFHIIELPFYFVISWFMITKWGISGAAGAFALRVAAEAIWLFLVSWKLFKFSTEIAFNKKIYSSITILSGLTLALFGVKKLLSSQIFFQIIIFFIIFLVYVFFCWNYSLDKLDRKAIINAVKVWQK